MASDEQIQRMRERITDEVYFALFKRFTGPLRGLVGRLVYRPTTRFSRIFAEADERAQREGLPGAGESLARSLNVSVTSTGQAGIPAQGPLLVVSNHPGAYDSVALCASIPRPDLKIIVFETGFYRTLENIRQRMIFATQDASGRMLALRQSIAHLQAGGAILTFGTGEIDPDPAVEPGAREALREWKSSLEIMLRKTPQTQLALAMVSGVLQRRFLTHPLTWFQRPGMDRRRLAEFLQVIRQLLRPDPVSAQVRLDFSAPVSTDTLSAESSGQRLMPAVTARAAALLDEHLHSHAGRVG